MPFVRRNRSGGALKQFSAGLYLNGKLVTLLSLSAWQRSSHTDYTLALDVDIGLEPDAIYSAALVCNVPSDVPNQPAA